MHDNDMTFLWLIFVVIAWLISGCAVVKPDSTPPPDPQCTRECAAWWMSLDRNDKDAVAIRCECRARAALVEGRIW